MGMQSFAPSLVGKDPTVMRPYLLALFRALDEEHVVWAVMRGWERLPDWTRYDIDILVARSDRQRVIDLVKSEGKRFGWHTYGVLRLGLMDSIWMVWEGTEGQSYLRIDIETGNSYRGIEIHESQAYLPERVRESISGGGLWRMPDGYAGAAVLLKQLAVAHGLDSERRRQQVLHGLADPRFEKIVRSAIKDELVSDQVIGALRKSDWETVEKLGGQVRRCLFRLTPERIFRTMVYVCERVRSLLKPYLRMLIVLVGPDGCGKTTIADAIVERFNGRPFQELLRVHMLFGVPRMRTLKALAFRLIGKRLPPQKVNVPGTRHCGMQRPHSRSRAMMYVTYYGLGMLCGRLKLFFWRTQGGLVLADRFYQDYYYMRGYMNCPAWYVRLFEVFAPKPDLIISLERPAEDIYRQKPELDIAEIQREQALICRYIAPRKNARIIDASQGVEQTIRKVNAEIEKWIASR